MSAGALAGELSLPLFTLRLERLFTRYMGEAALKLKLIFDNIQQVRGVYLFDEFDAIGQQRATANDVGEVRRILNSFLQLVEQDEQDASQSLVLAATNHPSLLDTALFRRFDDVLRYDLPSHEAIVDLIKRRLVRPGFKLDWDVIAHQAEGLSFADVQRACDDALKEAIVVGHDRVSAEHLVTAIQERQTDHATFSQRIK
jgi:AAA+ superfamily predicted ATPase